MSAAPLPDLGVDLAEVSASRHHEETTTLAARLPEATDIPLFLGVVVAPEMLPLELHHQVSSVFQQADEVGVEPVGFSASRLSPCTSRLPLSESPAERAASQLRRRKGTYWSWPT